MTRDTGGEVGGLEEGGWGREVEGGCWVAVGKDLEGDVKVLGDGEGLHTVLSSVIKRMTWSPSVMGVDSVELDSASEALDSA